MFVCVHILFGDFSFDYVSFSHQKRQLSAKEQLVLRLEVQYPADVGILAAFFLNYVKLKPGEALYLGPNEPHAYISGECIECMATSDNVVRAGLTSKKRDVQALLSMLNYKQVIIEFMHEMMFYNAAILMSKTDYIRLVLVFHVLFFEIRPAGLLIKVN